MESKCDRSPYFVASFVGNFVAFVESEGKAHAKARSREVPFKSGV
jgi:hypothetical protein